MQQFQAVDPYIHQMYDVLMPNNMVRTQLYLPVDLHQSLKMAASEKKISLSEFVRQKLHKSIGPIGVTTLDDMIALKIKGGPKDLSKNYKKYLYGGKK